VALGLVLRLPELDHVRFNEDETRKVEASCAYGGEELEMKSRRKDYMDEPLLRAFGRLHREATSALTILTWNVEQGGSKVEAIVEALQGPLRADLYALQELDRSTRRSGYQDLPEKIARQLGVDYVFGAEFEELAQGGAFELPLQGQTILSRLPILHTRILRFRHQPHNWGGWWKPRLAVFQPRRGGRMTLMAELQWDDSNLVFYNTHLESQASDYDRALQMSEILNDLWLQYPPETPVIIAGDLNTKEEHRSAVIRLLQAAEFHDVLETSPGAPYTSPKSKRRLDWIFARNVQSHDARIHPRKAPGHFPVTSTISMVRNVELKTDSSLPKELHRGEGENHEG
jgi:endonuclease/exonuclease/phosphatase family metal-dependent hydrolase